MSRIMRQCPSAISLLIDEAREPADLLDHLVVVVLGRDEFRAIKNGEQPGIVDAQNRRLQAAGEPRPERGVDVAARHPVVVGIGRRLPYDRDGARIDLAALDLLLPNEMVEHTYLVGARLHQLDRATVVARVAYARKCFVGVLAQPLANEMLGEQPARCRSARPEGEGLALDLLGKLLS